MTTLLHFNSIYANLLSDCDSLSDAIDFHWHHVDCGSPTTSNFDSLMIDLNICKEKILECKNQSGACRLHGYVESNQRLITTSIKLDKLATDFERSLEAAENLKSEYLFREERGELNVARANWSDGGNTPITCSHPVSVCPYDAMGKLRDYQPIFREAFSRAN